MKKTSIRFAAVLLTLVMLFALAACTPDNSGTTTPPKTNPTTVPTTGVKPAALSITVTPETLEIYAGDDIDLLFGVSASDAGASLIISDDNDFDQDTPGEYTITYTATLGDATATATRKVTVLPALSALGMEVRTNYLGEVKWPGNVVNFAHNLFVQLNADAELPIQSGVFQNTSAAPITLSVAGGYGCAAIVDANGVVLEGRDGANSKLVNAENPVRASSSVTTMTVGGESVTVSSAFAQNMVIPAGGYAIVIQSGYAGANADTDGRGFMNYNVIYSIGNVIRLFWVDDNQDLTSYVNQAPTFTGNTDILAQQGDEAFDLDTLIVGGITVKDDNGTFAASDDVTLTEIIIADRGGFDINKTGVYTITLSVSDGTETTTFTRTVEVKMDGIGVISCGDWVFKVAEEKVAIDQDLASIGGYAFLIYTPNYTGSINFANGFGEAFVLDAYGCIVRIYDGANGKYYDADHTEGVVDASKCTPTGYLTEAFASLQEGETLVVAPNASENNAEGGSRWFMTKIKVIGAQMIVMDLKFQEKA